MTSDHDDEIDSSAPNGGDENPSSAPQEEAASALADLARMKNEYLYLRAEFDNFRKNSIKERSQLIRYGGEPILRDLLDVVDNFDRALSVEVSPETFDSFKQGVVMTANELKNTLQKFGIKEQDPTGQPFDPAIHEALSSEPTDKMASGHVFKVFRKSYLLHDKMIRPAQVIVSREPESGSANGD